MSVQPMSRFSARLVGVMAGVVLAHAAAFVFPGLREADTCPEPWPVFPMRLSPLVWDGPPIERNVSVAQSATLPMPELDTLAVAHGKTWVGTLATAPPPVPGQVVNAAVRNLWMLEAEPPRNRHTRRPEGEFLDRAQYLGWFLPWVDSQLWTHITTTYAAPDTVLPLAVIEVPPTRCATCGTWTWELMVTLPYRDGHGKPDTMRFAVAVRLCAEGVVC
jgi:hypothetical protein